jgi:hypothetical protein
MSWRVPEPSRRPPQAIGNSQNLSAFPKTYRRSPKPIGGSPKLSALSKIIGGSPKLSACLQKLSAARKSFGEAPMDPGRGLWVLGGADGHGGPGRSLGQRRKVETWQPGIGWDGFEAGASRQSSASGGGSRRHEPRDDDRRVVRNAFHYFLPPFLLFSATRNFTIFEISFSGNGSSIGN